YNFKDERSSLKLAGTDIFRTQQNNVSTDFGQFNSMIRQYNDNQSIRLTYTYKFGNLKQQIKKRDTDSEEASRARQAVNQTPKKLLSCRDLTNKTIMKQ